MNALLNRCCSLHLMNKEEQPDQRIHGKEIWRKKCMQQASHTVVANQRTNVSRFQYLCATYLEFTPHQHPQNPVSFYFQASSKNFFQSAFSTPQRPTRQCALILLRFWRYINILLTFYLLTVGGRQRQQPKIELDGEQWYVAYVHCRQRQGLKKERKEIIGKIINENDSEGLELLLGVIVD